MQNFYSYQTRDIYPGNLSKAYIEGVISKFFPTRKYNNCNQLDRKKVRAYNINGTLSGGCKAIAEETRELVLPFTLQMYSHLTSSCPFTAKNMYFCSNQINRFRYI